MAKARRPLHQSECGSTLAVLMACSRDCKTQTALSAKSGVGQATIGRILRGQVNPQGGTLMLLAEALRIPLKALGQGVMSVGRRKIDDAMIQVLECRKVRQHAKQTLESLRRKENDAIDRLQELVWAERASTSKEAES